MITETGDNSQPFAFSFSEPEWSAVVAVSPPADAADLDAERKALEHVATAYLNLTHHHRIRSETGFPTKTWLKKRRQLAADLMAGDDLQAELAHAGAAVEGWSIIGRLHQGKRDPARDWLYDATLAMWIRLGGSMAISRNKLGKPRAAGITFMTAVLTLVMGDDAPGVEALVQLVKRARKRKVKYPKRVAA